MLALPERLTCDDARAELSRLEAALAAQPGSTAVRLNAAALSQFDSSALALLLGLQRQASERGQGLCIVAAPQRLRELAKVYGVLDLLALEDAPATA